MDDKERKIEQEMTRQRLSDELQALNFVNAAQLPGETYEQCLRRRATAEVRRQEILTLLTDW